jgi:hypothetical protein
MCTPDSLLDEIIEIKLEKPVDSNINRLRGRKTL